MSEYPTSLVSGMYSSDLLFDTSINLFSKYQMKKNGFCKKPTPIPKEFLSLGHRTFFPKKFFTEQLKNGPFFRKNSNIGPGLFSNNRENYKKLRPAPVTD